MERPYDREGADPPHRCKFCSEESPWCNAQEASEAFSGATVVEILMRANELWPHQRAKVEALDFALTAQLKRQVL